MQSEDDATQNPFVLSFYSFQNSIAKRFDGGGVSAPNL
jgi:hypothetical protein